MPTRSDFAEPHHYGIRHGSVESEQHALALHHGLAMLGDVNFVCHVCVLCEGTGKPEGHGHYISHCEHCAGTGLCQSAGPNAFSVPAFDSQRHQVLVAASRSLLLDFEVCVC